jgi:hypothetical protein
VTGFGALTLNGATTFTVWDNGTRTLPRDHYVLTFEMAMVAEAFADEGNLQHPWSASALNPINLETLGNGATLTSVTIT